MTQLWGHSQKIHVWDWALLAQNGDLLYWLLPWTACNLFWSKPFLPSLSQSPFSYPALSFLELPPRYVACIQVLISGFAFKRTQSETSLILQWIRICLSMQETQEMLVWSLGWEDPLEMAIHSSIPAWKIPWIEELSRITVQEVTKSWAWLSTHTHTKQDTVYWNT